MPIGYTPSESAEQLPTNEVAFQNGIQQLGLVDKPSEGGSFTNNTVGSYGSALTSASAALSALRAAEVIRDEILVSKAEVEANLVLSQENFAATTAQRVLSEGIAIAILHRLAKPAMTYTLGLLTRIDYDSGEFKVLSYSAGVLNTVQLNDSGVITTKTINYNEDGSVSSIT